MVLINPLVFAAVKPDLDVCVRFVKDPVGQKYFRLSSLTYLFIEALCWRYQFQILDEFLRRAKFGGKNWHNYLLM